MTIFITAMSSKGAAPYVVVFKYHCITPYFSCWYSDLIIISKLNDLFSVKFSLIPISFVTQKVLCCIYWLWYITASKFYGTTLLHKHCMLLICIFLLVSCLNFLAGISIDRKTPAPGIATLTKLPDVSYIFLYQSNKRHATMGKQGAVSIRKTVLPGMAIPMLKIRRPDGRLSFNMEIAIRR